MRTILFFLFTAFVSTGTMLSAIYTGKNIPGNYILAAGLWALFIVWAVRQQRKKRIRRESEAMFNYYMRERMRR
jgi:hypothetical protein